jgi:hypothetical protein
MSPRVRLRPFTFQVARGEERRQVTFYGANESAAREMARRWAAPRGWASSIGLWTTHRDPDERPVEGRL